jgi:glycosyltransferase involved in cell wall biosynthesis
MKGERIEAVMIVKNEEEVIERCLASLKGIDKVTILDTGSADGTAKAVAKMADVMNIEFHYGKYRWNDNFAEARNEALKYATCEWILIIDADEVLAGDSMAALRKEIDNAGPNDRGFLFRCFDAPGKHEHIVIRCHRRLPEIKWAGAIHNHLSWQDGKLARGVVLVYGHSPAHNNDPDRAFRILSREVALRPENGRETYYLAREYFSRGRFAEAELLYKRYIPMSKYAPEAADAHLMLARCALFTGRGDEAYAHIFNSLRVNADIAESFHLLAKLSGPHNGEHWRRHAAIAGNSRCLFIRPPDDMIVQECSATAPGAIEVSAPHEVEGQIYSSQDIPGNLPPVAFNHLPNEIEVAK